LTRFDAPTKVEGTVSQVFAVTDAESDCKHQLDFALQYISEKRGVVVYLSQEGCGGDLSNEAGAYALQ